MKKILFIFVASIAITLMGCNSDGNKETSKSETQQENKVEDQNNNSTANQIGDVHPEYLTTADFQEKIWDYKNNPSQWTFKGELPAVIDFYADWCKPCKQIAPIMDDLADHYDGKVKIYKVNTDKERELSSIFGIKSIPSILFIPKDGKPRMQSGAMSKEAYMSIIDEIVLVNKSDKNKKQEI
jgi:thioredoxin